MKTFLCENQFSAIIWTTEASLGGKVRKLDTGFVVFLSRNQVGCLMFCYVAWGLRHWQFEKLLSELFDLQQKCNFVVESWVVEWLLQKCRLSNFNLNLVARIVYLGNLLEASTKWITYQVTQVNQFTLSIFQLCRINPKAALEMLSKCWKILISNKLNEKCCQILISNKFDETKIWKHTKCCQILILTNCMEERSDSNAPASLWAIIN